MDQDTDTPVEPTEKKRAPRARKAAAATVPDKPVMAESGEEPEKERGVTERVVPRERAGEVSARGEATPVPDPAATERAPEVRPLAQWAQTSGADLEAVAPEGRREFFSVRLTHSGEAREFTDPREAGAAFFRADPAERPSVTHVDGNTARTMARTEIHGRDEVGEPRHVKSLPNSHAPDAAFRAGYYDAMEVSISERLSKADRGAEVAVKGAEPTPSTRPAEARIDAQLKDDLETYAGARPERAAALWAESGEGTPPGPQLMAAVNSREERMVRADAGGQRCSLRRGEG